MSLPLPRYHTDPRKIDLDLLRDVYASIIVIWENGNPHHVGGWVPASTIDRIASHLGLGAIGAKGPTGGMDYDDSRPPEWWR